VLQTWFGTVVPKEDPTARMEASPLARPASRAALRVGAWHVHPDRDEVSRDGRTVKLEPRVMRLLALLASRAGEVVGTDELLDEVWAGVVVTPASVYTSVARLRRVLEDGGADAPYIVTVPKRGYRLVAEVSRDSEDRTSAAAPRDGPARVAHAVERPVDARWRPARWRRRALGIAGAALAIAGVASIASRLETREPASVPVTVAVLPLRSLTDGDTALAELGASLSSELTDGLTRVPGLRVVASESTSSLDDAEPQAAGRRVGADYVVVGTVRQAGDRLRVGAQLVDVDRGATVWSGDFDRLRGNLLAVQTDLGNALFAALGTRLAREAGSIAPPRIDTVPAAFEAYVAARAEQRRRAPESLARAALLYREALAADPRLAAAEVGIAEVAVGAQLAAERSIEAAAAIAEPAIARALALDPASAEAYAARGLLRSEQWRLEEAEADLRRAIALNPNLVEAHVRLAVTLEYAGRPREALGALDGALALDPLHYMLHVRRCLALQNVGRHAEARAACAAAIEIQPQPPNAHWAMALAMLAEGRLDAAIAGYRETISLAPKRADLLVQLGWLYLDAGSIRQAAAAFRAADDVSGGSPSADGLLVPLVQGDREGTRAGLAAFVAADAPSSDALLDAAAIALANGDAETARRLVARASASTDLDDRALSVWAVRWGRSAALTLALDARADGRAEDAARYLDALENYLTELRNAGHRWPGIDYLTASVAALEGRTDDALRHLDAARDGGWRRAWWPRVDPALAPLRTHPRFQHWLLELDARNAPVLAQLGR
jgi:DNA-binding winged helix-turn-helix (wHTH) protein/TolB-like protein/Tfp pilus assembly protein PilF